MIPKMNFRTLIAFIVISTIVFSSCTSHENRGEGVIHPSNPNAIPSDTFWNASVHTFLVIPTATIVIVDEKGTQVKANNQPIAVIANYNNGYTLKVPVSPDNTAVLQIIGVTYPFKVTASDGMHRFSTVTVSSSPGFGGKIPIVMEGMLNAAMSVDTNAKLQ